MPLGFAFQGVALKLGFRDNSQLKWRFLCGRRRDISWQAQYFVRVRRVDAERFVAGAGNREVVSCGRGECRCHIGIGM